MHSTLSAKNYPRTILSAFSTLCIFHLVELFKCVRLFSLSHSKVVMRRWNYRQHYHFSSSKLYVTFVTVDCHPSYLSSKSHPYSVFNSRDLPRNGHHIRLRSSHFFVTVLLVRAKDIPPHVRESGFWNPRNFCMWTPESWKVLLVESGILGLGIRNIALGIRNPNPGSPEKDLESSN